VNGRRNEPGKVEPAAETPLNPRVSVIVASFNDLENLLGCLHSLETQDYPAAMTEIVVVDDGSTDGTAETVEREHPGTLVVRTTNQGAEIARNRGVDESSGQIIAFIDSDCLAPSSWLALIVRHLQRDGSLVIGGRIVHRGDFWQRLTGIADFGEFQGLEVKEMRTLPSCNMGLARSLFQQVRFDTRLAINADSLFAEELHRRGARLLYDPQVFVVHRPAVDARALFARARRYGRSFVEARKIDPSMRHAGFVRAGVPGVIFATIGRTLLDWWRLIRHRREAGFGFLEIPPAVLFLLLRRAFSLPEAVRAARAR
jgi:glycosyltransferase involved in cell wall biosynthesis